MSTAMMMTTTTTTSKDQKKAARGFVDPPPLGSTKQEQKVVREEEEDEEAAAIRLYDLRVDGLTLQTGDLSQRLYHGMVSRSSSAPLLLFQKNIHNNNNKDDEAQVVQRMFKLWAMELTAREAVKAALKQNGLELCPNELLDHTQTPLRQQQQLKDDDATVAWGDFRSIRLLDVKDEDAATAAAAGKDEHGSPIEYESWETAVDDWTPGRDFSFVVRHVSARRMELSLDQLLVALDPDGSLSQQAQEAGMVLPGGDDEPVATLADLAAWQARRSEDAPRDDTIFAGTDSAGYRVISSRDLRRADADAERTVMHVMDAFVSHGCLIVDLTDAGTTFDKALQLSNMWATVNNFYDYALNSEDFLVPGLETAVGAGAQHAKVGFASHKQGNLQVLETRQSRDGTLLPVETEQVLGVEGCQSLLTAFSIVTEIGKQVVGIVVAASTEEAGLLRGFEAVDASTKLVHELIDDGRPLSATDIDHTEFAVSMSPHRLCRYSVNDSPSKGSGEENDKDSKTSTREVFGAHTDTTFITAVPVAALAGLEVYDEAADRWYRPELAARRHWRAMRVSTGDDPDAFTEIVSSNNGGGSSVEMPWHARYAILMPGELLQIVSRDEVLATVHRVVVATSTTAARLSAPILLRSRQGTRMDCDRYLGGVGGSGILKECHGMDMQDIDNALNIPS